ncbi:MAG TPA: metallophosphoesterase [bacterium]|nr:metallophosphoesterase [bacterium]
MRAFASVGLLVLSVLGLAQPISSSMPADAVLVGAGDIASCESAGDEMTAKLLDSIAGTVFTAGDNVYERGRLQEFTRCFAPSWGRHKARMRPSPGNHDYLTKDGQGYFKYFGAAAGPPSKGYYAYNLGVWRVIVLNSNCAHVGGCHNGSPQERWLRAELNAHSALCTLAYWHHPRFSSGPHGDALSVGSFWDALYEAGAELIVNGHDHLYERFAPQAPDGSLNSDRGIRQFTVGTGGRSLYSVKRLTRNSVFRSATTFGVLKLTLRASGYIWQFVAAPSGKVLDKGESLCY